MRRLSVFISPIRVIRVLFLKAEYFKKGGVKNMTGACKSHCRRLEKQAFPEVEGKLHGMNESSSVACSGCG
jgi:hypothetical protein